MSSRIVFEDPDLEKYAGDYTIIESSSVSTIAKTWVPQGSSEPRPVAVKQATVVKKRSRCPHDITKELDILRSCSHPNIIEVLDSVEDAYDESIQFWMPYCQYTLSDVLASPRFTPQIFSTKLLAPFTHPDQTPWGKDLFFEKQIKLATVFAHQASSLMFQILLGVDYLHNTMGVAHRDLKPGNVCMTTTGCVKLIDFGIAYRLDETQGAGNYEPMWPESRANNTMHFEISTGAYRAPELLFGTRSYDPLAIDSWSLGVLFADFFRPLRLYISDEDDEAYYYEDEDEEEGKNDSSHSNLPPPLPTPGYIRSNGFDPSKLGPGEEARWIRDPLFNGSRGEIGLAASIFKLMGTPNERSWPEFRQLPHAGGISFNEEPGRDMESELPNLPHRTTVQNNYGYDAIDLIKRFLIYVPASRMRPSIALDHPFFKPQMLFPDDYPPNAMAQICEKYQLVSFPRATWVFSQILPGMAYMDSPSPEV